MANNINEKVKKILKEKSPITGELTSVPRESDITGFVIKYDDGTEKFVKDGLIIYENAAENTDISKSLGIERNGSNLFTATSLMCLGATVHAFGLDAVKLVQKGIEMINNKGEV